MEYTHEQAQMLHDTMEEYEGRKEEKEMEYCGANVREVIETHYPELFNVIAWFNFEDCCDLEDWLNQKTHFVFTGDQWESYTLDLISEGEDE